MPYQSFHDLCPQTAEAETRSITVLGDDSPTGLPPGQYVFCESFCNEPRCDCRRVFFCVISSFRRGPEAVIAWGWEKPEFYAMWMHDDDPETVRRLVGPCLNLGSPATELADALLDLARNVLLRDAAYVERVKRHYRMFRNKIDAKAKAEIKAKRSKARSPKRKKRRQRT